MITTLAIVPFLKALGFAFCIIRFEPLRIVLEVLSTKYPNLFTYLVTLLFTCFACCSFWIGLIFFGLWYGVSAFFFATILDKTIIAWLNRIKL